MANGAEEQLTRRERQIMDVVYRFGSVTAATVQAELPDPPSYSAVRAMLRKLEDKGHLTHREQGARYVYEATVPRESAQETALERLVRTFFDGSPKRTVQALLELKREEWSERELEELSAMIERARRKGRS
jgi:BlaI family transcriptional regulator, penicillinase repressor